MVKFLFSLLIFALAFPVSAQKPARPTVARPTKISPSRFFSSDMEKLPLDIVQNDYDYVYKALSSNPLTKAKDEFESTAAYQKRGLEAEKISLGSGYTVADDLCFINRPAQDGFNFDVDYDADKAMFEIDLRPASIFPDPNGHEYMGIPASRAEEVAGGSYIARTILGVPFRVRRYTITERLFAFDNFESIDIDHPSKELLTFKIHRSPAEASLIKPYFGLLLVVRLKPPFVGASSWTSTPSLDDPKAVTRKSRHLVGIMKELWLISTKTGEVFQKIRFDKKEKAGK